jgi:predicted Zn-dependent protease
MRILVVFLLGTVVVLSGCSSSGGTLAPVEDRTAGPNYGNAVIPPAEPIEQKADVPRQAEVKPYIAPTAPEPVVVKKNNPAVTSLVSIADNKVQSGDYESAAAALERALRHDSQNAELWHRLAEVRLFQHQPEQTESLALKSNALASGERSLMAKNWRLISKARRLRGDGAGADEAEVRAYQLSK